MPRFVTITGCSGGGKSSLIAELERQGHSVISEPGRRIVMREMASDGAALPWRDPTAFAREAIRTALADRAVAASREGWTFLDRGIVDALAALDHASGGNAVAEQGPSYPLHWQVFVAPPWPEIFQSDAQRPHGLEAARQEYERLVRAYRSLGYALIELPKTSVGDRADFVLNILKKDRI